MNIKQYAGILLTAVFIIAVVILPITTSVYGQTINEAIELFDSGQLSSAESALQRLLSENSKDATVLLYLGKIYRELNEATKAENYLLKAVGADKNLADGYYELGQTQLIKKRGLLDSRSREAMKYFEKALKIDPMHGETKFALYETYFKNDDPDKAEGILKEYIKENPESTKGFLAFARMQKFYQYNVKIRLEFLRELYSTAFNTNPDNPEELFEIGWGLFLSDDLHEARLAQSRGEFLSKDVKYNQYLDMMVVTFESLDYGTARDYFDRAIEVMPTEIKAVFTDTKRLPKYIVDDLSETYEVTASRFLDSSYIPNDQRLYVKQLYHYAVLWLEERDDYDRLKPINYTGVSFFEPPYLLHGGLHNHLDFAFYYYLREDEKSEFLSIANPYERAQWRQRWFRTNDATPTNDKNEPEDEFLKRVEYVYEEFKITPNRFNKEWHANDFTGYDDRGKVFLKYGPPADWYTDPGGLKDLESMGNPMDVDERFTLSGMNRQVNVKANQSWTYLHLDNYLAFDFVEMNEGYFTYVESLEEAIIGGTNFARLYMNENRAEIGGPYMYIYNYFQDLLNDIDTRDERLRFLNEDDQQYLIEEGVNLEMPNFNQSEFLFGHLFPEINKKNEVMKNYPTNIVDIGKPKNRLPILYEMASFKGEDGKTRLEVYTLVEYRNLGFKKEDDDKLFSLLEYDIVVKDKDVMPVVSDTALTTILIEPNKIKKDMSVINMFAFDLKPEEYTVFLNARNLQGDKETSLGLEINLRDYHVDSLIISDIQLSLDIKPASERNLFVKNDLSVVPYPYRRIDRSKEIYIYYEVYNLSQRPNGSTSYTINSTISVYDPNNTLMEALKSLFPGRSKETRTTSTDTHGGIDPDAVEFVAFDLNNLSPGKAMLTIEIIDNVSGKKATRSIEFEMH